VLEKARTPEQVAAALEAIPESDPGLRAALRRRYEAIATQRPQKDHGAGVRTVLLKALRPLAQQDEVPLLEAALWSYEFPHDDEVAGGLRGAALVILNDLDPELAAFHAARLLSDPHTADSGEPALTAAQVFRQRDQVLPLYAFAVQGGSGEVLAECLRQLAVAPTSVVKPLAEAQLGGMDEIALLGLIDLLIAHPDQAVFGPMLVTFLRETATLDVYRYGVTATLAARSEDLIREVRQMAARETDPERVAVLREALSVETPDRS
jgi:hypothetical protein